MAVLCSTAVQGWWTGVLEPRVGKPMP
jgi:hypothetical protein